MVWISRADDRTRSFILFGSRIPDASSTLTHLGTSVPLESRRLKVKIDNLADRLGVDIYLKHP